MSIHYNEIISKSSSVYFFSKHNKVCRKPIFRSSAIFTYCINKNINTKILFLGYWLIKRNINEISILITIRDENGIIIKRYNTEINCIKSYEINIKKEILEKNIDKNFFGSIELEVFSSKDMVFPLPCFCCQLYWVKIFQCSSYLW